MTALLAVDKLEVVYHRAITAVQGVTLAVEPGQIVALLGTNGAGKTTTLRAISGFLGIDDARVTEGAIASRASASRTGRRTRTRGAASCWCPSATRCFPISRWRRISSRRSPRGIKRGRAAPARGAGLPVLSRARRSARAASAGCCPAASGRCWRSAARWCAGRSCCWSTSCRSGLRRSWCEDLLRRLVRDPARARHHHPDRRAERRRWRSRSPTTAMCMENGRIVLDGDRPSGCASHPDIQEFYLGRTSGERRSYRDVKQYRRSRRWYG